MKVSRTINPLHFEDLEPHRFEDLVRQLIYDFRPWARIEATGRAGSDEGADIVAAETIASAESAADDVDDETTTDATERIWIFQCKREKSIPPSRLKSYVAESLVGKSNVYGFVLASACDFSTKARNTFREAVRSFGIREAHLWGKAELEDRLFLPQFDHLLFAYFGISLHVQRRSRRSELQRKVGIKRKLMKLIPFEGSGFDFVLLRDPDATDYPYIEDFEEFKQKPRWMYFECLGHIPPDHLRFLVYERVGWVNWESGEWDIPRLGQKFPGADRLFGAPDPWTSQDDANESNLVPDGNRATIKIFRDLSYNRILAIDDLGDAFNRPPHLLVEWSEESAFFEPGALIQAVEDHSGRKQWLDAAKQINHFPKPARKPSRSAG